MRFRLVLTRRDQILWGPVCGGAMPRDPDDAEMRIRCLWITARGALSTSGRAWSSFASAGSGAEVNERGEPWPSEKARKG